jgi:hypothetical protein
MGRWLAVEKTLACSSFRFCHPSSRLTSIINKKSTEVQRTAVRKWKVLRVSEEDGDSGKSLAQKRPDGPLRLLPLTTQFSALPYWILLKILVDPGCT